MLNTRPVQKNATRKLHYHDIGAMWGEMTKTNTTTLNRDALSQARGAIAFAATYTDRGVPPPAGIRRLILDAVQVWALTDDTRPSRLPGTERDRVIARNLGAA